MRVLTLNLWGRHGDWPGRRAVLAADLATLNPDLIAFQESILTDDYDQVGDLLGPDYETVRQTAGMLDDGNGSTIVSRWPITGVWETSLDVSPRAAIYPCAVVVAEVRAPEPIGTLFLAHHSPAWQRGAERDRELQAVATARFIENLVEQRGPRHVILPGDFNAIPEASSIRFWTGRASLDGVSVCYEDAWERLHPAEPGHTFTPRNPLVASGDMPLEPGRRIDYVMQRCDENGPTLRVASCALAFAEPVGGVWATDHFGVVADLEPPAGARV